MSRSELGRGDGAIGICGRVRPARSRSDAISARTYEALERVGLDRGQPVNLAANLSYGRRKYLEIARALAMRPNLLILDEPAAGLNDSAKPRNWPGSSELCSRRRISTIMLVEHDMTLVMSICSRVDRARFRAQDRRRRSLGRPQRVPPCSKPIWEWTREPSRTARHHGSVSACTRSCTASISTSAGRMASSRCSDRTGSARRPCCALSPASTSPRPASIRLQAGEDITKPEKPRHRRARPFAGAGRPADIFLR